MPRPAWAFELLYDSGKEKDFCLLQVFSPFVLCFQILTYCLFLLDPGRRKESMGLFLFCSEIAIRISPYALGFPF